MHLESLLSRYESSARGRAARAHARAGAELYEVSRDCRTALTGTHVHEYRTFDHRRITRPRSLLARISTRIPHMAEGAAALRRVLWANDARHFHNFVHEPPISLADARRAL